MLEWWLVLVNCCLLLPLLVLSACCTKKPEKAEKKAEIQRPSAGSEAQDGPEESNALTDPAPLLATTRLTVVGGVPVGPGGAGGIFVPNPNPEDTKKGGDSVRNQSVWTRKHGATKSSVLNKLKTAQSTEVLRMTLMKNALQEEATRRKMEMAAQDGTATSRSWDTRTRGDAAKTKGGPLTLGTVASKSMPIQANLEASTRTGPGYPVSTVQDQTSKLGQDQTSNIGYDQTSSKICQDPSSKLVLDQTSKLGQDQTSAAGATTIDTVGIGNTFATSCSMGSGLSRLTTAVPEPITSVVALEAKVVTERTTLRKPPVTKRVAKKPLKKQSDQTQPSG